MTPLTILSAQPSASCTAAEALVLGGFAALVVAFLLFVPRKVVSFRDFMGGITTGVKSMVPAFIILTLAWTISGVCRDLLMSRGLCEGHVGRKRSSSSSVTRDRLCCSCPAQLCNGDGMGNLRHFNPDRRADMRGNCAAASCCHALRYLGRQRIWRSLFPTF